MARSFNGRSFHSDGVRKRANLRAHSKFSFSSVNKGVLERFESWKPRSRGFHGINS